MDTILKEAFEYHRDFNLIFLNDIETHFGKLPAETYPLFCHLLNAHQIWNARILGKTQLGVVQVHELSACRQLIADNHSNTLQILQSIDMEAEVVYQTSRGEAFHNKVRDILFHIGNHSTHHRAQIASQFRQAGLKPPVSDYIFYKRQQQ